MSNTITVMNLKSNRAMPLNSVLKNTNKFTLLGFEPNESFQYPDCIKVIINENDESEELITFLNYIPDIKAYGYHLINKTIYPKHQTISVEVLVNEENYDASKRYSFSLVIKEDNDDDGDGYFIKRPKSSPGKTLSTKYL